MSDRIRATYQFDTGIDPERAAAIIAGEQSSGTFVALARESDEIKDRSAARIERLEPRGAPDSPPLPGAVGADVRRFELVLSWPVETVGASIGSLMATIAGNLFELREVAGLKLLDFTLPAQFAATCPGPAFGIAGTREISGIAEGPLVGTIIKPSVGLDPAQTAEVVADLCRGGIDFIKDDELQSDAPLCPFDARLAEVSKVLDRHEAETGRRPLYAINLTGEIDEMCARHDAVLAAGGNCVMVNLNSVGPAGLLALRRHAKLPIHGHRNGWGYLGRSENNGWAYPAWHKIWRLAGADHMHVNALANKFWEPNDSVLASARACHDPLFPDAPMTVMPVFSSGQTVHQVHETWARLGSADLIHTAGGGIMGHPDGIAAGVDALRRAWDAAIAGIPLDEAAQSSPALARARDTFA